ncbi:hypothetical protein [Paenibacillus polymyxa]
MKNTAYSEKKLQFLTELQKRVEDPGFRINPYQLDYEKVQEWIYSFDNNEGEHGFDLGTQSTIEDFLDQMEFSRFETEDETHPQIVEFSDFKVLLSEKGYFIGREAVLRSGKVVVLDKLTEHFGSMDEAQEELKTRLGLT